VMGELHHVVYGTSLLLLAVVVAVVGARQCRRAAPRAGRPGPLIILMTSPSASGTRPWQLVPVTVAPQPAGCSARGPSAVQIEQDETPSMAL
jgi:hypothetical protein